MVLENEDITELDAGFSIIQRKDGFRFGTDAVLLSDFFQGKKNGRVLEIGTGNGIIPILLKIKNKIENIDCLEIQEEVSHLAKRNVKRNGMEDSINIVNMDVNDFQERNSYDYILSNPPYMTLDGKQLNSLDTKIIARHELKLNLSSLFQMAKKILKPRGEIFLVHRSYRFYEISKELEKNGFSLKRVKFVYFSKEKNSNLVLIQASKGRKNILEIEPPIFLNEN